MATKQIPASQVIHYTPDLIWKYICEFAGPPFSLPLADRLGATVTKIAFELIPPGGQVSACMPEAISKSCLVVQHHAQNHPGAAGKAFPPLEPFVNQWLKQFFATMGQLERMKSEGRDHEVPQSLRTLRGVWMEWVCPPLDPAEEEKWLRSWARRLRYPSGLSVAELRSRAFFPGNRQDEQYVKWEGIIDRVEERVREGEPIWSFVGADGATFESKDPEYADLAKAMVSQKMEVVVWYSENAVGQRVIRSPYTTPDILSLLYRKEDGTYGYNFKEIGGRLSIAAKVERDELKPLSMDTPRPSGKGTLADTIEAPASPTHFEDPDPKRKAEQEALDEALRVDEDRAAVEGLLEWLEKRDVETAAQVERRGSLPAGSIQGCQKRIERRAKKNLG